MPLNLLKMAVGVDDIPHLASLQRRRLEQARTEGGAEELRHVTRHTPRRAAEIIDGGSIYWIVKGFIQVRQRILRFDPVTGRDGTPKCAIILDPELVPTTPRPHRPMQGWRYLTADNAPPDGADLYDEAPDLPPQMARELRELGLL